MAELARLGIDATRPEEIVDAVRLVAPAAPVSRRSPPTPAASSRAAPSTRGCCAPRSRPAPSSGAARDAGRDRDRTFPARRSSAPMVPTPSSAAPPARRRTRAARSPSRSGATHRRRSGHPPRTRAALGQPPRRRPLLRLGVPHRGGYDQRRLRHVVGGAGPRPRQPRTAARRAAARVRPDRCRAPRGTRCRSPFASRRPAVGRFLLTGDAASLISPFTGEGIYSAIVSGALAGEAAVTADDPGTAYTRR